MENQVLMREIVVKPRNADAKGERPLEKLIVQRTARVGIIGIGYVGLPLAMEFAKEGFPVTGFDVDAEKVRSVAAGRSYIPDIPTDALKDRVDAGRLSATSDFAQLAHMDAIIVCVPTPLRKTKDPDISYILAAVEQITKHVSKGQLIVLESTTYPGTTREIVLPALEKKGLKVGRDFYLAFSPERVDPGNKRFAIRNTPKIVGGITTQCTTLARALYGTVADKIVPVSSAECAEMVKLLENTFRAVNIGLVNEVALMCDKLKLDTWEVIAAAATKPFGFMPFFPGPGLGGHCIPLDPHYLSWKLKMLNFYSRFIELAGEINSHMPEHVVRKAADALNTAGKPVKGSQVLVLGVAYKKDISDMRESPAIDVIQLLKQKGAHVDYSDPHVPHMRLGHDHQGGETMKSVPLTKAALKQADIVVITTDHSAFNMREIVDNARLVLDTRNATGSLANDRVVKL